MRKPEGSARIYKCSAHTDDLLPCREWARDWYLDKRGVWTAFCADHKPSPIKVTAPEQQASLFDDRPGLVSHNATPTQRTGAGRLLKSGTRRWKVWKVIDDAGERGVTDYELEMILQERHPNERWTYTDFSPRRRELMTDGVVIDSGDTRKAHDTGSPQTVWRTA